KMHLEIKLNFSGGDTLITLYQNSNDQFFKIYFSQLITNISVDPNNWVVDFSNIIHTEIEDDQPKIESFYLSQNFPNPFNSITTIKYDVPEKNRVMLKIYNVLGKELVTLIDEEKAAGNYEIKFESKGFSSGIYFYKMQAGNFEESKKMILLR
ncbi:MAG: T9SS type A sorting domain-containing protein, partial [Ignavibacteriaceae bacterium]|nr:T9SS type A sorting domain-containing protein [Ignavibacteriaceae bacterium]